MSAAKKRSPVKTSSRKGKSKLKRFLIGFLVILFLVFGTVAATVYFYGNDLLKKFITETVKSDSEGLYQVEIRSLYIDVFTGSIRVNGFQLIPDTALYRKIRETDTVAPFLVYARVDRLRVTGIEFLKALRDKNVLIKKILVQSPELEVHLYPPPRLIKKTGPKKILLAIPLPAVLHSIGLGELQIRDGKLTVYFHSPEKTTHIHVPDIAITATSFFIDSKHKSSTAILNTKDITIELKNLVLETPDKMNTLSFGKIRLSTSSSDVTVNNFHLKPAFSKKDYSRKLGYQSDRLDVQVQSLHISQLDLRQMLVEHKLVISSVAVDGLLVDDYRDKRVPERRDFFPPMPQQALLKTKQYLKIDKVTLMNGKATYSEQVGPEPGVLFFDKMSAVVTNLTNDSDLVRKKTVMDVQGTAWLMGKGKLTANIRFPLGAPHDAFTFSAVLSRLPLTEVNPMLTKLAPAIITAGDLTSLVIPTVYADNESSRGIMKFSYSGLKVNLINQKQDNWSKIKTTLLNTAANMYIQDNNPPPNGKFRTGVIYFKRNKTASIFNFLWKSTFSGLKSTMGINNKEQKELKKKERKKKGKKN